MKYIKRFNFTNLNEGLTKYQLDEILDKISELGIDSLSNHEKKLLKSNSDNSIDVDEEIRKHINKYKKAKSIIQQIPLETTDAELEKNIGRYIKFKKDDDWRKLGLIVNMGTIYEIVSIQKHWGHVNGKYVRDKIGYRVATVGEERCFGRPADVDKIEFVDMTEEEATKINNQVELDFKNGNYPDWYYK
tara:strand:+ start:7236 stop:7802 length:567 start_codon:yes stop_codon:yes gene_type:complete